MATPATTPIQILNCPMDPGTNDAEAVTVRDYLLKLLTLVWEEGGGFNGKRPFGKSSWEGEIEVALIRAGLVKGSFDSDGYIESVDSDVVGALVTEAIQSLGSPVEAERRKTPGQRAYEGYVASCGGLSVHGDELPAWDDQSPAIQAHWHAAACAISG